jgi:hypothetical protein
MNMSGTLTIGWFYWHLLWRPYWAEAGVSAYLHDKICHLGILAVTEGFTIMNCTIITQDTKKLSSQLNYGGFLVLLAICEAIVHP